MTTPVLSKKQQRHSLSAKKTPVKGLRNVLTQHQEYYWPVISSNNTLKLEGLLKKLTPVLKRPSSKIPWSQLRHMKKEERIQARKETMSKEDNQTDKQLLDSVITGINAVTRALEKNNVCSVLLDSTIDPPLLIKHIVTMGLNKKVPVLLVPFLKSVTANTVGYMCTAFALKNVVAETSDHYFHLLHTTISEMAAEIPQPKNSLHLFKDIGDTENGAEEEETIMNIEEESESNVPKVKFTLSTDVYKYRTSCKERAFVPPTARDKQEDVEEKMKTTDFISIGKYESASSDEEGRKNLISERYQKSAEKNSKVHYLPLKVKRLQGNSNRAKATKISKKKKK